ncbi:MAG: carbon-nitrogen hydrolase [Paludibacteraceae bacterium]|nr:carbon-nitrogen hydrolase [Paludibacteraceae bacterium]
MKIALIQQANTADVTNNKERLKQQVRKAAEQGAQLVVLPELHNTLYFCQTEDVRLFDLAETVPGPSTDEFATLAKENGCVLVLSLFERVMAGVFHNTAVVIERDGSIAGCYRKMHIPDDPGFYEKFYFTPGDMGFEPIDTSAGRLGVMVCWDQWYPEGARLMALKGAELLIYPTAIGFDPRDNKEEQQRQREAWITVQRGHAVANGIYVAACNRTGLEHDPSRQSEGIQFWGSSFIAGPQGEFVSQAELDFEGFIMAEINKKRMDDVRRIWPFFRDRRIDQFGELRKRSIR